MDVQNVIAPPKEKSSTWKKEVTASSNEGENLTSSDVESKKEKNASTREEASEHSDGKADRNGSLDDSDVRKGVEADGSPGTKDTTRYAFFHIRPRVSWIASFSTMNFYLLSYTSRATYIVYILLTLATVKMAMMMVNLLLLLAKL